MPQTPIRLLFEQAPISQQLGEIARYPLRGAALLTVFVLTAFGLLAWLPGAGWFLSLVVYFSGYYYAFEILLRTANGRNDPPMAVIEAHVGAVWRLLGLLLLLLVAVRFAIVKDMAPAGVLVLALFTLIQPCLLASLAMGAGLLEALNPANALRMIGRIGASYFLIALALFIFQLAALLAGRLLASLLPAFLASLLVDALFYWGLFASFHLLGRLMYQYHDRLGYTPTLHEEALPTVRDRDQALLDRVDTHVADGNTVGAITLLLDEIREHTVTKAVHERYRQLLRQAGDGEALDEHAGRSIAMLAHDKQDHAALALLREAVSDNPAFARLDPGHGEWLAQRALDLGMFRLAVDAWRSMLRIDPRHPNAVEWALRTAQLLHERFNDLAGARDTLHSARAGLRDASAIARIDTAIQSLPSP